MKLAELKEKATPILKEYDVKQAAVFGSVSRGEDGPESDIDLLIEFGEKPMGMFAYMGFIEEMEETLGRKLDVVSSNSLNKFLKPYIVNDLKTIYER